MFLKILFWFNVVISIVMVGFAINKGIYDYGVGHSIAMLWIGYWIMCTLLEENKDKR
jgi:hypothetical protein